MRVLVWLSRTQGVRARGADGNRSRVAVAKLCCVALALVAGLSSTRAWAVEGASDDASAASGFDLTLSDAIAIAMRNNRRLVSGRISRERERFALQVAEREFQPEFRVGTFRRFETEEGGWARDDTGATFEATLRLPTGGRFALVNAVAGDGIDDQDYDSALTLRFTQPLLRGRGFAVSTASLRIARATEEIGQLVFERAIGDVARAVVFAYRDFLQAQRSVGISARSLQRAQDLLATNRSLIQAGRMAELEIVQAEADVAQRELVLIGAENRLDAARLALVEVLDVGSDAAIQPTEALSVGGARSVGADSVAAAQCRHVAQADEPAAATCPVAIAQLLSLALANRPEYLQARLRVENAEAELLVAKNNRLWDLSATFAVDVDGNADSLRTGFGEPFRRLPDDDLRVALELNVPIRDIASKQRYVNARGNLEQAHVDLAELRQSLDIAVRNAVRNVDARLRQVDLASRASELAERKLEAEKQKLRLGLTTNFRIIFFEDDLVRAQTSELSATIAYLNALSSLDQTLGTTLQTWGLEIERIERLDAPGIDP